MVFSVTDAVSAYSKASDLPKLAEAAGKGDGRFDNMLKSVVGDTIDALQTSESATIAASNGKGNIADVILAVNNAESMLTTVVSIRDKVLSAYQEIMRTSV